MSVVVCTDLWGKELHRQLGMKIVVTPGKPMWCNGSTPAWDARDVGSSPALGHSISHFHHTHDAINNSDNPDDTEVSHIKKMSWIETRIR